MRSKGKPSGKVFSVEQANAMLPLVRAITSDLVASSREVVERRRYLSERLSGGQVDDSNPYHSELADVERDVRREADRLQEYLDELRELGVEPKDGVKGLIDFPSMMEGRPVYLCWMLGEPEVAYWHELDAGYAGRQPLTADTLIGGGGDASQESGSDPF